jgi:hypothetical protein
MSCRPPGSPIGQDRIVAIRRPLHSPRTRCGEAALLDRLDDGDRPHPSEREKKPDDAVLFDFLLVWAPDEKVRHGILVENPEALYDYPRSA